MRLLITGASGHLGQRLVKAACKAGYQVTAWTSPRHGSLLPMNLDARFMPVELTDPEQVAAAFCQARPLAVIHAAALSTIAECYRDPVRAFRINGEATRQLVGLCVAGVTRLIYVSTDLVFDGSQGNYSEHDPPCPQTLYGKSKLDGERVVLHHPGHLVCRLSLLVGKGTKERRLFFDQQVQSLRQGQPIQLFTDEWRTPLGIQAAAEALIRLATSDYSGLLHLGGPERLSRYEMGCTLANLLGVSTQLVQGVTQTSMKSSETRPSDVSLNSQAWRSLLPDSAWPGYSEVVRQEWGTS
ncbi:MAG: SDR family oxidoreductase [Planctomycetia bacterium]|nr:SDR family oxidoreductase [Planctomycetia bacterium]